MPPKTESESTIENELKDKIRRVFETTIADIMNNLIFSSKQELEKKIRDAMPSVAAQVFDSLNFDWLKNQLTITIKFKS